MLALLVAGAVPLLAVTHYSEWAGDATGVCQVTIEPFQPWQGILRYDIPNYDDGFYGYWGIDERNTLSGGVDESLVGGYYFYNLTNGEWNYYGHPLHGTWNCLFSPNLNDTCDGDWVDCNETCDGDLWGTEQ
jgi:hypothetical protein